MSTGYSLLSHVFWITLQILVFGYHNLCPVMANALFTPYVSEFEYASRFHPSRNPDCSMDWPENANEFDDNINQRNFESPRYGRSPEEGSPVGQEPSIEVRAILLRCPKTEEETDNVLINRDIYNITAGRSQDILDFHGSDRDEPNRHSEVHDCRRKLIITMKFNNIGRTKTQEEFVVIDHVLDPVTMHKARLLNPFVVKVRQEPVLQLYGLKFDGVVNAEATEEVINNKQSNYMGCDDSSKNPTCGQMFFEDKPIPYSQGFCCSCDPEVNHQKETSSCNESIPTSAPSFFARAEKRLIRPDESARTAKKSFSDVFSYPDGKKGFAFPSIDDENMSDSSKDSYKDERDLINLKNSMTMNKNVEKSLNSKSDDIGNEKKTEIRDTKMGHKAAISWRHPNDKDGLSKRRSPMNLIDQLTELEEDYKNFRISRIMNDEQKKDPTSNRKRLNNEGGPTLGNEKFSDQRLTVNNEENFRKIESLEKKLFPKSDGDNRYSIPTSDIRENLLMDKLIYGLGSAPIINVSSTWEAENKLGIDNVTLNILSRISSLSESSNFSTTVTAHFETPVILLQKLSSDRVFPQSRKNRYSLEMHTEITKNWSSHPTTKMTLSRNAKFDRNVGDLLAGIVFSESMNFKPQKNLQSVDNRLIFENRGQSMTSEKSFTSVIKDNVRITPKSGWPGPMGQRDENDFTRSFDELSSRAENSTDSSSSFFSGNHTKNDAIVSSGSLRNQLGNWLTYEEGKQYETRAGGKSLSENYEEKIEFGNKDKIEGKRVNGAVKNHDIREDRSNIIIAKERPVQVYLGTRYNREALDSRADELIRPEVQSREVKPARSFLLNYLKPEDVDVATRKKSKRSSIPQSHRSIAEDDRLFRNDDDQQSNIDKKIDDKFEEISDVLTDAGNAQKIIRAKPKSDNFFENDDAVMQKYSLIFHKNPEIEKNENDSIIHQNSVTVKTELSRNLEDNRLHSKNDNSQKNLEKSNPRNIKNNGYLQCNSHDNVCLEKYKLRIAKFDKNNDQSVARKDDKVVNRLKVDEHSEVPEVLEKSTQLIPVDAPIRHLIDSNNEQSENPLMFQTKFPTETGVEMALKKAAQVVAERFINSTESPESPSSNKNNANRGPSIYMIKDRKKELRKQAVLHSPLLPLKKTEISLNPGNVERHWKIANEVRGVNTRLTPAERSEDLIAEAETLPPDEEINSTVTKLLKVRNFRPSVETNTFIKESYSNSTVFPRFVIRNLGGPLREKKTNEVLILVEDPSPSHLSPGGRENARDLDESIHHHHTPPKNHNNNDNNYNNQLARKVTNSNENAVLMETVKNKNGRNSLHEPTIQKKIIVPIVNDRTGTTKIPFDVMPIIQKTQNNDNNLKISGPFGGIRKDKQEFLDGRQQALQKTIRQKIDDSSNDLEKSVNVVLIASQDRVNPYLDVNKTVPHPSLDSDENFETKKFVENTEPIMITKRSRRNLQNFPSRKFQSFYPRSSDIIAISKLKDLVQNDDREASNGNNEKDDTVEAKENKREALIFYDYEDAEEKGIDKDDGEEESDDDLNIDTKRSLDNFELEKMIGGLEPLEGWKEKMEMLKLKKHADVLKEYLNWRQDVLPQEPGENSGYTKKVMSEEYAEEITTSATSTSNSTRIKGYPPSNDLSTCLPIAEKNRTTLLPSTDQNPIENSRITESEPMTYPSIIETNPTTYSPITEPNPTTHTPIMEPHRNSCLFITETNPTTHAPVMEPHPTSCSPITEPNPTTHAPIMEPHPTSCSPIIDLNPTTDASITEPNPTSFLPTKEPEPILFLATREKNQKTYSTNVETIPVSRVSTVQTFPTQCDQQPEVTKTSGNCQQEEITKTSSNCQQEEITKTSSNCQQEEITKTSSNCQQEEITKTPSNCQQEEITKTSSNCQQEEITKISSNCQQEKITEATVVSSVPLLTISETPREHKELAEATLVPSVTLLTISETPCEHKELAEATLVPNVPLLSMSKTPGEQKEIAEATQVPNVPLLMMSKTPGEQKEIAEATQVPNVPLLVMSKTPGEQKEIAEATQVPNVPLLVMSKTPGEQKEITEATLVPSVPLLTMSEAPCKQKEIARATVVASTQEPNYITTTSPENPKNVSTTLERVEIPTGCFHLEENIRTTTENSCSEAKESTGRILPPCDSRNGLPRVDSYQSTPQSNIDVLPTSRTDNFLKNISNHRNLTGMNGNACLIVSILKQSLLADKKSREMNEKKDAMEKMNKHEGRKKYAQDLHKRRRRSKKKKIVRKMDGRPKVRSRRKLMSVLRLHETDDDYEEDEKFEDNEIDKYADFTNDMDENDSDIDEDNAKLNLEWNNVIDKILHGNVSTPLNVGNSTKSWFQEIPHDHRSALKRLHIYDTDKYIKNITHRIIHNRNKYDLENEKDIERPRRSGAVAKRKLMEYSKNTLTPTFKREGSRENEDDLTIFRWNAVQKRETSNVTAHTEPSADKDSRDFANSLSGKIHVEGGTNGQLMSIDFDAPPDITKTNETVKLVTNESAKSTSSTKVNGANAPDLNVLSNLLSFDPVPIESENISPKIMENTSFLLQQIPHFVRDDSEVKLLTNRHKKFTNLMKNAPSIRKKRATDPLSAERSIEGRRDENYDRRNIRNSEQDDDTQNDLENANDYRSAENYNTLDSNVVRSGIYSADAVDRDKLDNREVKVFQIVPLEQEQSPFALSELDRSSQKRLDSKESRLKNPQYPKNFDENVPGTTVKPGKIAPADLPWKENEYVDEHKLSFMETSIEPQNPNIFHANSLGDMQSKGSREGFKNLNLRSNRLHDAVPLIHIQIHQRLINEGKDKEEPRKPSRHEEVEMAPQVVVDNPTPSRNNGIKWNDENSMQNQTGPVLDMDDDRGTEESSEPYVEALIKPDSQIIPSILTDKNNERKQPSEESLKSENDENHSLVNMEPDLVGSGESRKEIHTKNMLAILEFMKKINGILRGNEEVDLPKEEDNAILKLERLIIVPQEPCDHSFKTFREQEASTESEVMIGDEITHKNSCSKKYTRPSSTPSTVKTVSTKNYLDTDEKNYQTGSRCNALNNPSNSLQGRPDQSFLFNDKDSLFNTTSGSANTEKDSEIFSADKNKAPTTNLQFDSKNDPSAKFSIRNIQNILTPRFVHLPNNIGAIVDIQPDQESGSEQKVVSRNFGKRIDDFIRDVKIGDQEDYDTDNFGKSENEEGYKSVNKRKSMDTVPSVPKADLYRAINPLSSEWNNHVMRDSGSFVDQSRLPTGLSGRMNAENSKDLAMAKGIPREKRRRRKKKRRHKKKRRQRKKKQRRKSGNQWNAVDQRKSWWPFKRQLMSLRDKRPAILESNFYQRQMDRLKPRKRANRRFPLKHGKIRRLPGSYYPLKKEINKEHRGHSEKKRKKKKTKNRIRQIRKKSGRNKRQINPGGTQTRGGQDCMDRRHPPNANPVKYLESAHCLRFSDLWYSAYELENPIMEHTVYLQLYEKHSLPDGTTHWDDLTQGTMVRMGTFTRHQRDEQPTIVFTYTGARTEPQNRALNLDPSTQRLLVPSPVAPNKASQYTAVRGPGEYLVVQSNLLSKDGKECDKAGVGFAAFAKQDDRCGRPKGTCLKNQPLAYWRHDMKARDSGRPGCYFLSNFATVPTNPIKYNVSGTGSQQYLGLEYHSAHVSAIDIEVRTDYNAIVRVGSSGRVTEVYVDSTSPEHTVVTVVISNMGLASSPYQPRITDCPTGLPVSWTKAKGVMQVIPPQHDQRVTLDLYGKLLLNGFHCTVEIVNHRGELVAMRRIRVQKMDRCFCVWHCLCACIGSVGGIGCQPMSLEHYHAAGFQGPVPVITTEASFLMNSIKEIVMLCTLLVLLLLLLGFLKWFVGLFVPVVGRWGLESLLEGTKIEKYLEAELRCRCVITDENGVPVHPDTGQRTVRICSRKIELFLNLLFFVTYPIVVCCNYCKRSWRSSPRHHCCPNESTMGLIKEKTNSPKLICVNTYGDTRNSKLEAEDTRYVINELKKSQESLQNPKGPKKKDETDNDKTLSKRSITKSKNASNMTAKRFVTELLKQRIVFRNLTEPIGGLFIPFGTIYSLRGYFLSAENGGYRFITSCPFKQYWHIENDEKKSSDPPIIYPCHFFMSAFNSAREVYESNEISFTPEGICINVPQFNEQ